VQLALPELLEMRGPVQQQIMERTRMNLAFLRESGLRVLGVEGGWYAIVVHEEEAAVSLLRDHNVLVQPGYFYDFEQSGYIVISLLTRPDILSEGIAQLRSAIL
jgi:aspartate/methionine/tyrosine aminotransferase